MSFKKRTDSATSSTPSVSDSIPMIDTTRSSRP
jgi:hypothetical protein